jgi:hypothetical protein
MLIGIVFVLGGCTGLAVAAFGQNFTVGDADAITSFDRPASKWSSRLVSGIAGVMLLGFGIKCLICG